MRVISMYQILFTIPLGSLLANKYMGKVKKSTKAQIGKSDKPVADLASAGPKFPAHAAVSSQKVSSADGDVLEQE